jgi:hypothetical protein
MMKSGNILKCLGAASLVAVLLVCSSPQAAEKDKTGKKTVDFLFVQNAESVTLKDGVLTLKGVSPDTLYFSDRPNRIAGRITVADFVKQWSKGKDSFKSNPPNAVLTVLENPTPKDIVVILKDPRIEGDDLVYSVEVTDGEKAVKGEASALFIDIIGRPATPLSFAGAARRSVVRAIIR